MSESRKNGERELPGVPLDLSTATGIKYQKKTCKFYSPTNGYFTLRNLTDIQSNFSQQIFVHFMHIKDHLANIAEFQ